MTKHKALRFAGWAVLAFALVLLGVPLVVHVLHLGLAIVKLVIELAITAALLALGVWLLRKSR